MFIFSENFKSCMKDGHVLHAKCRHTWKIQVPSPSNEPISSFLTLLLFHLIGTQRSREMKHCKKAYVNFVSENHASSAFTAFHLNGASHSLHKQNYPTAVMTKTQKYRNYENGERQMLWQLSLNLHITNEEAERNWYSHEPQSSNL